MLHKCVRSNPSSNKNIIYICQGVAWVSPEKPHPPSSCHGVYEGQWHDHPTGYLVIFLLNLFFRATHLSQNVAFQSSLCRFFRKPRFYWFLVLLVYVPWNKALIFLVSGSLLHLWHPHRWGGAAGFEDLLQLAHLSPGLCQGRRLTIAQFTLYSLAVLPFIPF